VRLDGEEVVTAQMGVTIGRVRVDACRLDDEADRRPRRLPAKSAKRPRTLVMRWRTWKAASEWVLSMAKVRRAVAVAVAVLIGGLLVNMSLN
jgi:hypothetical protein